jgi:hypothetical protein
MQKLKFICNLVNHDNNKFICPECYQETCNICYKKELFFCLKCYDFVCHDCGKYYISSPFNENNIYRCPLCVPFDKSKFSFTF